MKALKVLAVSIALATSSLADAGGYARQSSGSVTGPRGNTVSWQRSSAGNTGNWNRGYSSNGGCWGSNCGWALAGAALVGGVVGAAIAGGQPVAPPVPVWTQGPQVVYLVQPPRPQVIVVQQPPVQVFIQAPQPAPVYQDAPPPSWVK